MRSPAGIKQVRKDKSFNNVFNILEFFNFVCRPESIFYEMSYKFDR